MINIQKHWRTCEVYSRQRLPLRAGEAPSPQVGWVSSVCSSSKKPSQPDIVPPGKQTNKQKPFSLGLKKSLVCTGEGPKAKRCMYVKLCRNKHEAQPKLIREGHLLCATHTILRWADHRALRGKGQWRGGGAAHPLPSSLDKTFLPVKHQFPYLQNGDNNKFVSFAELCEDHMRWRTWEDTAWGQGSIESLIFPWLLDQLWSGVIILMSF